MSDQENYRHISAEEFAELDFDTVTLLDLREPDEVLVSGIESAINLPFSGGNAFITTSIPEGARVSVKSQELTYNYDSHHPVERKEVEMDESWFYTI